MTLETGQVIAAQAVYLQSCAGQRNKPVGYSPNKFSGLYNFRVGTARYPCTLPALVSTYLRACYRAGSNTRYRARGWRLSGWDSHPLAQIARPVTPGILDHHLDVKIPNRSNYLVMVDINKPWFPPTTLLLPSMPSAIYSLSIILYGLRRLLEEPNQLPSFRKTSTSSSRPARQMRRITLSPIR